MWRVAAPAQSVLDTSEQPPPPTSLSVSQKTARKGEKAEREREREGEREKEREAAPAHTLLHAQEHAPTPLGRLEKRLGLLRVQCLGLRVEGDGVRGLGFRV